MRIIKDGVRTCADEESFKNVYEPKGWKIDNAKVEMNKDEYVVKKLNDETKIKNYTKMKKQVPKKFDDNLIKSQK